jgi:glycosyltransferase involved in cell wall biosynthesis
MRGLSLIIPMFNEKEYVHLTISEAISIFESLGMDYEIIIIDDASNDGSEKTIDVLSGVNKKIKVIHFSERKHLGALLKSGFLKSEKDIIIYTDMDMPFDLRILKDVIPLIDRADVISGFRINGEKSLKRFVYSKCYNMLIRKIFKINIKDINFAMKIFKREILSSLQLKSESSFINAEFLIKANALRYNILQLPVTYTPRKYGKSKLSSLRVIFKIVYEMIKLYPHVISFRSCYAREGIAS